MLIHHAKKTRLQKKNKITQTEEHWYFQRHHLTPPTLKSVVSPEVGEARDKGGRKKMKTITPTNVETKSRNALLMTTNQVHLSTH
jgi:hypothetical protein